MFKVIFTDQIEFEKECTIYCITEKRFKTSQVYTQCVHLHVPQCTEPKFKLHIASEYSFEHGEQRRHGKPEES